jgi:hypothetical protein
MRLAPHRLPGSPVTFVLHGRSDAAARAVGRIAIHGSVMDGPSPNTRIDPYSIFSGASAYQGLAPAGPHPWRNADPGGVYPCLLLMLPHYELLPVGPAAGQVAACGELVRAISGWARQQGIRSVALEYLTPEAAPLLAAASAEGFSAVEFASRCDLEVTWRDFDGYLRTLPSRRGVMIRRELRALAERGIDLEVRGLGAAETALIGLRCQLVAKYGGSPDPAKEAAMLDRLRGEFAAGELTVVVAQRAGRPLGFGLFVQEGTTWIPILTGADYTDPDSRLTYFATLFYRPSELAPGLGIGTIAYGLGSWQAKRLRGCKLAPLFGAAALLGGGTKGLAGRRAAPRRRPAGPPQPVGAAPGQRAEGENAAGQPLGRASREILPARGANMCTAAVT